MTVLRSLAFNVTFFVVTALACIFVGTPCLVLPRRCSRAATNGWARVILWLLEHIVGLRYQVRGEVASLAQACVIAPKHQSAWDTIVFFAICPDAIYVLKKELMLIPFYGWNAHKLGMIGIDRGGAAAALRGLIRAAKAALAAGRQVVIFPQGTRVPPRLAPPTVPAAEAVPYQPGIAALYGQLEAPVIPVALNSGLFWGKRSFIKRSGTIVLEVLPAIPPGLDRKTFMARLEQAIEQASDKLAAEATAQDTRLTAASHAGR
jgi:1-acyl-sn-glycerol-3-phosphate acyltransferase